MHEFGLVQNIIDIVREEIGKTDFSKVLSVKIVVGELSGVMDESVQMYFDVLSKNTPAAGAVLIFNKIPAEFKCTGCSLIFTKAKDEIICPGCGGFGVCTGRGTEFYVESMEVE